MTKDEALKLALKVLEYWDVHGKLHQPTEEAITALRETLAQPEPVACFVETEQGMMLWPIEDINEAGNYCEENEFPILLYTTPSQCKPLSDEQVNLFINGRGDEDDEDYIEPTGDGFGLTDADLMRLVRRVEAAHGIKENT